MAIQYVGGNTGTWVGATSGNTTISLTALTGGIATTAAAGDLVIAIYGTGSTANRTLSITDGTTAYTSVAAELYSNGTSYDTNLLVAYKYLSAADTSTTFGPTGSTSDAGAGTVYVFRGVSPAVFDVTTTTATGTSTGRPTPPAITPVTAGTFIVCVGAGAAATGAVYTTATLSAFRSVTSAGTNDSMIGVGYFTWTSGTYTPAQFSGGSTSTANSWAAMTLAIRPPTTLDSALTETATATTTQSPAGSTYTVDQTETATVTELEAYTYAMGDSVAEYLSLQDSAVPSGSFYLTLEEINTVWDSVVGAPLWQLIDDMQNANWQNTDDVQSPGWGAASTDQSPNWTPVAT